MVLKRQPALDLFLLQAVDGCLAGVIFLVPLLMGGRHPIGQLVLTILAVAAALAWAIRQSLRKDAAWRWTGAAPLFLAAAALTTLQVVPLPPSWLEWLSPRMSELLPLWRSGGADRAALGGWSCVSLTPAETLGGLTLLLDYALLFLVAVQRIHRVEDVERLLRWCALSAVGMAAFGIVQLLAGNGKFFWFYDHPFTLASDAAKGSFSNRNHFAHFLALGIGPLIWWLQDESRRARSHGRGAVRAVNKDIQQAELKTYLLGLALGIVLFAGLLSLSRGGIAVLFLAATICTLAFWGVSAISGRLVAALAAVAMLIGASLGIFGFDRVSKRLDDFSAGSIDRLDREAVRRTLWATTVKAFPDYVRLGAGVGSFSTVYPLYTDALPDEGVEYTHAENGPLQVALETGVVGLGLALTGIALGAFWCVGGIRPSTASRWRLCAAAISASLAASVAHALVDFVWYVPACMAMVALLAACANRVYEEGQATKDEVRGKAAAGHPRPTLAFGLSPLISFGLAVLGIWMIANRVGPALAEPDWDAYRVSRNAAGVRPRQTTDSLQAEAATQERWIAWLDHVVCRQPTHARAHLALAESHRRLFDVLQRDSDNPMSLMNIRDAAVQSRFPSRDALIAWLSRAVGKHWTHLDRSLYHARQAVALEPFQGRAYVYLADLSFLIGADAAVGRACVDQALRVRPFDGAVLYAAGNEAFLAGHRAQWLDYVKRAFQSGPRQQQQIMTDLTAGSTNENLPAVIDFIVHEFTPDLASLRFLHGICAKRCPPASLTPLARHWVEKARSEAMSSSGREAANVWMEACQLHAQLGNEAESLDCVRNAVQCDPSNFSIHYQLAARLLKSQLFAEAEAHFRWCQQRAPGNPEVEAGLRHALKGRLDNPYRAAGDAPRAIAR